MKNKCFGEFLCANCGRVIKQSFTVPPIETSKELEKFYDSLGVECECGMFVQQYIPVQMRTALLTLASKGYRVSLINTGTLAIILNEKLDLKSLPELPFEFSYDTTEKDVDIIMNARMAADDFEGLDKDQYIKEAIENLTDWCRALPVIKDGEYIDLTKEESNDGISE